MKVSKQTTFEFNTDDIIDLVAKKCRCDIACVDLTVNMASGEVIVKVVKEVSKKERADR